MVSKEAKAVIRVASDAREYYNFLFWALVAIDGFNILAHSQVFKGTLKLYYLGLIGSNYVEPISLIMELLS